MSFLTILGDVHPVLKLGYMLLGPFKYVFVVVVVPSTPPGSMPVTEA